MNYVIMVPKARGKRLSNIVLEEPQITNALKSCQPGRHPAREAIEHSDSDRRTIWVALIPLHRRVNKVIAEKARTACYQHIPSRQSRELDFQSTRNRL